MNKLLFTIPFVKVRKTLEKIESFLVVDSIHLCPCCFLRSHLDLQTTMADATRKTPVAISTQLTLSFWSTVSPLLCGI